MKKNFIFLLTFFLFIAIVVTGLASDLAKRMNASNSNVIAPVPPIQKNLITPYDAIQNSSESNPGHDNVDLARRGCCSHHGGVCGCDEKTDRIICCDGTLSPSCTCSGY